MHLGGSDMSGPKMMVLGMWLVTLAGFVIAPESTLAGWGRMLFWVLLAAHVVETAIFLPKLRAAGGSLGAHIGNTLVFGVAHMQEIAAEKTSEE
jgi:uncharacterized protein YhhL (DUF1145 family)